MSRTLKENNTMAIALFVLGHSGSGKTQVSKKWVKSRIKSQNMEPWSMIDKDHCGNALGRALMMSLGLDPDDRDSLEYKEKVRDLEYQAALDVIAEQLKLGVNVIIPGPWNKELLNGKLFSNETLGFPSDTLLAHVYLDVPEFKIKKRIIDRNNSRDTWKIEHWDEFRKRLGMPITITEKEILTFNMEEKFEDQEKAILKMIQANLDKRQQNKKDKKEKKLKT